MLEELMLVDSLAGLERVDEFEDEDKLETPEIAKKNNHSYFCLNLIISLIWSFKKLKLSLNILFGKKLLLYNYFCI